MIDGCKGPEILDEKRVSKSCYYRATITAINLSAGEISLLFHYNIPPESPAEITVNEDLGGVKYNNGLCHLSLPDHVKQSPLFAYKVGDEVRVIDLWGNSYGKGRTRFILISTVPDLSSGTPLPPGYFGLSGGFFVATVSDIAGNVYCPAPSVSVSENIDGAGNVLCSTFEIQDKTFDHLVNADSREIKAYQSGSPTKLIFVRRAGGPVILHDFMVKNQVRFATINLPQRRRFVLEKPEWGKQFVVTLSFTASQYEGFGNLFWEVFENQPRDFGTVNGESNGPVTSGYFKGIWRHYYPESYSNVWFYNDSVGFAIDYETGNIFLKTLFLDQGYGDDFSDYYYDSISLVLEPIFSEVDKSLKYPESECYIDELPVEGVSHFFIDHDNWFTTVISKTGCNDGHPYITNEKLGTIDGGSGEKTTVNIGLDLARSIRTTINDFEITEKLNYVPGVGNIYELEYLESRILHIGEHEIIIDEHEEYHKEGILLDMVSAEKKYTRVEILFFDLYHSLFIYDIVEGVLDFVEGSVHWTNLDQNAVGFSMSGDEKVTRCIANGLVTEKIFTSIRTGIVEYGFVALYGGYYCNYPDSIEVESKRKIIDIDFPTTRRLRTNCNLNMFIGDSSKVKAKYTDDSKSVYLLVEGFTDSEKKSFYYDGDSMTLQSGAEFIFSNYGFDGSMFLS